MPKDCKIFNGIVRVVNDIEQTMPFDSVLNLPSTFLGKPFFNFILFEFEGDKERNYYNKPYIKECMESWKKRFPLSRFIYIKVEDCLNISNWTKYTYNRRNYPTDSLRIYFTSLLDNCFYVDTDVFISEKAEIPTEKDSFVYCHCSGTMTWNKKRNNKKLGEWFDWYEDITKRIIEKYGEDSVNDIDTELARHADIPAYESMGYRCTESVDDLQGVSHFSAMWPAMCNHDKISMSYPRQHEQSIYFASDSYWAWTKYCIDRGYDKLISIDNPDAKYYLGFYDV